MDWGNPPKTFETILFKKVDSREIERFYAISWQPTLFHRRAVVRQWGRKDGYQKTMATPFATLEEAWPTIRSVIKCRLKRGYRLVAPAQYRSS